MSLLCALSDKLFDKFRVHLFDSKQALQWHQRSRWCGWYVFLSAEPTASISLHSCLSSTECDRCLSRNYFKFSNTVTVIVSQNFYQNCVISKNHPYFSRHQKHKHYVITVTRQLTEYSQSILERLVLNRQCISVHCRPCNNFLASSLITMQDLLCVSHTVWVHVGGPQNFGGCLGPTALGQGRG